ncbi:hypothetical protein KSS87_018630 [Heliosperma pusillum]|nr:hypothetical protein KSS87_018630 [Heliosperma pusillum]
MQGGKGKRIFGGSSEKDEGHGFYTPRKHYHRHTLNQTQRLERMRTFDPSSPPLRLSFREKLERHQANRNIGWFYRKCAHPNENQRRRLGIELGLKPTQIKYWFQNKRTQTKRHNKRADTETLRTENDRLRSENVILSEVLKNALCIPCGGTSLEEKIKICEKLQQENSELKHEVFWDLAHRTIDATDTNSKGAQIDKLSSIVATYEGKSLSRPTLDVQDTATSGLASESPTIKFDSLNINPGNISLDDQMKPNPELEKLLMIDIAASAMDELIELLTIDQPFSIKSPTEELYVLNHDSYYKMVARSKGFRNPNPRIESSKFSAVVAMDARLLVDLYLDPDKWVDVFPTVFSKAKTICVLRGGLLENRDESLQLLYEQAHMLTPALQQRDFYLLRYCRQIETGVWVIGDVSYNCFGSVSHDSQTFYWKHPSGCMIEEMPNGLSRVTCVERVEVVDDFPGHSMYADLVNSTLAFGAKRWISTLQRTFERYAFLKEAGIFNDELGIGNKSMTMLGSKLIKSYCSIFSLFGTSDLYQLSELTKNGVQITCRKNTSPDLPVGKVIIAASSFWVPASPERVFSYLNDHLMRSQWDILCTNSGVHKISQIPTGHHSSNAISILQPENSSEEFVIFQESVFEQTGSLIVYAPVEMTRMLELTTGVDPARVPILASGFAITPDGPDGKDAPSTSTSKPLPAGSLITVAFQILACTSLSIDDKVVSTYLFPMADALVSRVVRVIKNVFD